MSDLRNGNQRDKAQEIKNKGSIVLGARWFIIVFITLYFSFAFKNDNIIPAVFWVVALPIVYNVIITLFFVYKNKNVNNLKFIFFCDATIIAMLSYHLGGINSDIFILFFFVIGYYALYRNLTYTITIVAYIIVVYSISCAYSYKSNMEELNYFRLIAKDILLVLASLGMIFINGEMKKYGDMHRKEFRLARTDKLTGLANRHYFDQKLVEEVEYVEHSGNPLNILIFDLDNFKRFNDTYGHLVGDKLLTLFSNIIMQNIRKYDIPVRYGGEEFIILIRDLNETVAKSIAERIRRQLEKQRIYIGDGENKKKVTVSCGLSQYPHNSPDIKEAIEFADKALYHAKEIGKNIVVSYDEIGHVQQSGDS